MLGLLFSKPSLDCGGPSGKALHTKSVAMILLLLLYVVFHMMSSPEHVWVRSAGSLSQNGFQQLVLGSFLAQERQAQANSSQALCGMYDAGKGCQLQSFTNLLLCNM